MSEGEAKDLLQRARGGEIAALGELFEQARPLLRGKLRQVIPNWQDVDDLLQDTFLKARFAIKKFRGDSKPSSWLYRIAINLYRDRYRKKNHRELETIDGSFPEEQARSPLENPESGRTKRGGQIERFSAFRADQNQQDGGVQYEEIKIERSKEILRVALERLTTREQEVVKLLFFSSKRIPAKQLAAEMGFADCARIYEIRRKFAKHCFRARDEFLGFMKATPPVINSP